MRRLLLLSFALLLAGLGVASADLLSNGDFEQPLDVGWTQDVRETAGDHHFERTDTLGQPVPGYTGQAYKYLAQHACLYQAVEVPSVELELAFDGRFQLGGGSNTCWPAAALVVCYRDQDDAELGKTMYVLRTEYCTWEDSDTLHLIDIEDPGVWAGYRLEIARELADNLAGINPGDVAKLRIELYSYDSGT